MGNKDVDLSYLASQTEKFTGADLTEICQRAAKIAIRENIARYIERERLREELEGEDEDEDAYEDPVPEIKAEHFELAMQDARRSVSDSDLMKYSSFATRMSAQKGATG